MYHFEGHIREAVESAWHELATEHRYHEMRKVLRREIALKALREGETIKRASYSLDMSMNTLKAMVRGG